jgi:serine/threonine-protein kinase
MTRTTITDPAHWRRIDALLTAVLALSEAERAAWFAALPDADRALEPTLRSLLARATGQADAFMKIPASAGLLAEAAADASLERRGAEIGPYRLIREIGTGGMGRVWLAERTDGSLQRQVAIKLPRTGWARGVAERLTQERDALAALEHPNIARLYDAGTIEGGRPYIAMEYIDGTPINEFVASQSCSLRQRLELFLQVAGAVAFAHAQLIIHRDIKPQNILVSNDGVAHLLDFGAAKLLGRESEENLTRQVGGAWSPDYASPEQIRGERVTVATDVYSLGVLLYEMLTGQKPYRLQRQSAAALEEAILKASIPSASSIPGLSRNYTRLLRGDLDAILHKALNRRVADRYASVQAFADDVQRHLSGEAVLAQRASRGYLLKKFVVRNRIAVGAMASIVLAVGVGAVIALWQARIARAEAVRAQRVKEFVASIFTQATPKSGIGGTVTAADLLGFAAGRLDRELGDDPAAAAELGLIIANSYEMLGYSNELEPLLSSTVRRAEQAYGPAGAVTLDAKIALASAIQLRDPQGALAMGQQLLPLVIGSFPENALRASQLLESRSFVLAKLSRRDESYAALRQSLEISEKYLGPMHERTIRLTGFLSNTYSRFGDREPQLTSATEAMRRATLAFGALRPHNTLIMVERWYADALRDNDRPGDALPILRRVVSDQLKLDGQVTLRVRNAKLQLGNALMRVGAAGEALAEIREAVALEKEQNPVDTDDRRGFAEYLASALLLSGYVDEALAEDVRIEQLVAKLGAEPPRATLGRLTRHARLLALAGRPDDALPLLAEVERRAGPDDGEQRLQARLAESFVWRQKGNYGKALSILTDLQTGPGFSAQRLAQQSAVEADLGLTYIELGKVQAATKPLGRCESLYVRAQIEPSIRVASCLLGAARLHILAGRKAEAMRRLQPLVASWERANPNSPGHGEALYWLSKAQALDDAALAARTLARARPMLATARQAQLRRLIR